MRRAVVILLLFGWATLFGANPRDVAKARREFEDAFSEYGKLLKKRRVKVSEVRAARRRLRSAIRKLASLNDSKAVRLLLTKCMNHPKFWVVSYTWESLKNSLTDERAKDEVARFAMRARDLDLQYVLARLCLGWKTRQVGRLFEQLADRGHWRLKVVAAKGLAYFKTGSAKGRLERLVRDKNLSVRLAAASSLLVFGYPKKKIPEELLKPTYVDGPFLPKTIFTQRLIIIIDASNPMNTKMALTQDLIAERLKEIQKQNKNTSVPQQKKPPTKQEKEEFYRKNFVVTRFDFAKMKVRKLIQNLPKQMELRVLFVSSCVEEFTKKGDALSLSDRSQMEKFWRWFEKRQTYPGRDLVEAFKKAFADPLADTVLLITCGGPDKSNIDDFDEFLKWFKENNFFRGLRVHVAAVTADYNAAKLTQPEQVARQEQIDRIVSFLTKLAQAGEGRFTAVSHLGKVAIPAIKQEKKESKQPVKEK